MEYHTFKSLLPTAMKKWSLEDCKWIAQNSGMSKLNKRVAEYVMKKKFNQPNNQTK